jgi:secretion/DNA translocation related TadE-like protein
VTRPAKAVRRPGTAGWWREQAGGATLVGLALVGFVLLAGLAAVDVGALAAGRAAAQTAADMAALAALTPGGGRADARAARVAEANGAELLACRCTPVEAVVSVRRRVRLLPAPLSVRVGARARAVLAPAVPRQGRWPPDARPRQMVPAGRGPSGPDG